MKKLFTIATLSLMIGLVSCSNPFQKEKKDNTPLLLGLAVLANQPRYEATVSLVMKLTKVAGNPIPTSSSGNNGLTVPVLVKLNNKANEPEILIKENNELPKDYSTVSSGADNGDISLTFKLNSPTGKAQADVFACRKDGGVCSAGNPNANPPIPSDYDNEANYTHKHGSLVLKFNLKPEGGFEQDKTDTPENDVTQVVIESQEGVEFVVKQVNVSIKGIYNLQNPTVGENICDGKNVTGAPEVISGNIQGNKTISGAAQLQGTVYVTNGATLTVEAGTVVFGNRGSSLFVLPGGKLITKGNKNNPVCFTSAQAPGSRFPGDWGGIVIIGNGKGTRGATTEGTTPQPYGTGTDDADNSGSLEYTIIEFAGNEVAPGDELNALSLYAVGSGTKIEHVQVHRGLDDGFEAWGGAVNMKYLVATGGLDDDYDLDEGYTGNIEYIIGHKYPASCGGSPSTDPHGFEMDGIHSGAGTNCSAPTNTNGGQANRCTNPNINYFTMLGGGANNSSFSTASEAARLREGFAGNIDNGIFFGYEVSNAANYINGATSGTFPANTWKVLNNVYADQGKSCNQNGGTCSLSFTLTSLPIASVGNVPDCGFGANKPDYTTNTASGAPASVGASGGSAPAKWWEGWTVYRAR